MSDKATTTSSSSQLPKLTKKQKKALAFRDKSTKSKKITDNTTSNEDQLAQMADLHVPILEESGRHRSARDQVQMGDMERGGEGSAERRGEATDESPSRAHHVISPKQKQDQRQGDLSQQEKQRVVGTGGSTQRDGDRPRQGKHAGESERTGKGETYPKVERTGKRETLPKVERPGKGENHSQGKHTRKGENYSESRRTRKRESYSEGKHTRKGETLLEGEPKHEKKGRKRKRGELDDGLDGPGAEAGAAEGENKKRKREKIEPRVDYTEKEREGEGEEEMSEIGGEDEKRSGKAGDKQRYILFIGNLKYTTSVDTIKTHFSACDPPPEIRLLTPKASASKQTSKSKGCAFLEFTNRTALQQALKLHHSTLEGRMINVELTAGGGGKGEKRMEKLKERNKALLGQRKKRVEKTEKKDGTLPSRPDKPQRYSATSGVEQTSPEKKRTWTVGDVVDDEVHRGGQRHKAARTRGSRKSKAKDWATGVNAIPVS